MKYNNHFFISRPGNKRNEAYDFINLVNFDNIKNIIEPFCGSSALSFHIWLKYGNKYNYYLNDNCPLLIELYELFKNDDINNINNEIIKIRDKINNKDDWNQYFKTGENTSYKNLFFQKYSSMGRIGFYPLNRIDIKKVEIKLSKLQQQFVEFIKCPNVYIMCFDWFELFDKYKNDKDTIIIFDPPYINCHNDFYLNKNLNIYQYFFDNKDKLYKSHIYFILEDSWIIRLLFNNYNIIKSYEKKYELSKNTTTHIILYNYSNLN